MQLIIFELAQKQYAVEATHVVEMTRLVANTPLPNFPAPYVGVINYHGNLIPALRPEANFTTNLAGLENSHMIVMQDRQETSFCLVVDRVLAFAEASEIWNLTENATPTENSIVAGLLGKLVKLDNKIIPVFAIETLASLARKVLEWSK